MECGCANVKFEATSAISLLERGAHAAAYAALSEADRGCVAAKFEALRGTGIAEDQATTLAFASCRASLDLAQGYRTVPEPGGRVRVLDVPLFAENKRAGGGHGKGWLVGALRADEQHRAAGYHLPLHFGHHEPGVSRERAGHAELKSVRLKLVHGEPRWTLFGDKVYDTPAKAQKALREYPHRSVEISPDHPTEINSVALLGSEAPYFRFPEVRAYRALAGGGSAYLWSGSMDPTTKPAELPKPPEPEKAAAAPPTSEAPPAWAQAILATLEKVNATLAKLCEGGAATEGTPGMTAGGAPIHSPIAAAAATLPAPQLTLLPGGDAKAAAQYEARIAVLEGAVSSATRKIEAEDKFKASMSALAGYALPDGIESKVREHVAKGTAETFVATVVQFAAKLPRPDLAAGTPANGNPSDVEEPEAKEWSQKYGAEWGQRVKESLQTFRTLKQSLPSATTQFNSNAEWLASDLGVPTRGR